MSRLAPEAYTPLSPSLACVMLAEQANLVTIPFIQEGMTVRAKSSSCATPGPLIVRNRVAVSFVMRH